MASALLWPLGAQKVSSPVKEFSEINFFGLVDACGNEESGTKISIQDIDATTSLEGKDQY